jgi:hypothetical protein
LSNILDFRAPVYSTWPTILTLAPYLQEVDINFSIWRYMIA